jgi:hypothetical protein
MNSNSWTTERLTALRPGERFMYYRGDFDTDIARSSRNAPTYSNVLSAVKDIAAALSRQGHIDIEMTELESGKARGPVYQYVAVGRRRGADPLATSTTDPGRPADVAAA